MKKKVCFFLNNLSGGGAEKVLVELANYLAESDHEVHILLCKMKGENICRVNNNVILKQIDQDIGWVVLLHLLREKVITITMFFQLLKVKLPKPVRSYLKIKSYLNNSSINNVITSLDHANLTNLLLKVSRGDNHYCILREAIAHSEYFRSEIKGTKDSVLDRMLIKYINWADKVICVSDGVKKDFQDYFRINHEKLVTIYNPIIKNNISNNEKLPEHILEQLKQGKKLLLSAGRLTRQKRFDISIRAVGELAKSVNCIYLIFGTGELKDELAELIKSKNLCSTVYLMGYDANYTKYLSVADIFLLSSDYEGCPNVLLDALPHQVHLIATDAPHGSREILGNGKYGTLTKRGDYREMAKALTLACNSTISSDVIRLRAQKYSIGIIAGKYLSELN